MNRDHAVCGLLCWTLVFEQFMSFYQRLPSPAAMPLPGGGGEG